MITPPLTVVDGTVTYDTLDSKQNVLTMPAARLRDLRWSEISYLPQGSMYVLIRCA